MIFRVGMENNNEGFRSIAWALEHPGCFAYGQESDRALESLAASIHEYHDWIAGHEPPWFEAQDPELILEETFTDFEINATFDVVAKGEYAVEPFFQYEWKPLGDEEIGHGLKLLAWGREELLQLLTRLNPEQWKLRKEGERWDIAGIVNHVGGAEWWYLDRLGLAFPRAEVPPEPLERLEKVRQLFNSCLPQLVKVNQVVGIDGELWSPRKVLRRAAWHERDHFAHIRKLL